MRKKKIGFLLCLIISITFTAWFLFTANISEPWRQIINFIKTSEIITQNFSLEIMKGFVSLDIFLSGAIIIFLTLIVRKPPKIFFEKWKKLLDLPPWLLFYDLVGKVAAEEIFFRYLPLAILLPLWQTPLMMWILITVSSLIFGALHVLNQLPGERKIIFTLPQIVGGITLSYVFLAFGFWGAMAVHLLFDVLLFSILWLCYRLNPSIYSQK